MQTVGAVCSSYYQKVAAATETKPFPPPAATGEVADAGSDAPLYDDLGTLSSPITTKSPLAQRYFDQGLRLAYGFNHAEARRAFRTAQKHDPDCAMCAWGEALVLGPNINAPMEPEAVAPALAAVRKAQQNAASANTREQALIAAIAERYSADPKAERHALDIAYAEAMERIAARFPEDDDIQAFYAEALMDLDALGLLGGRRRQAQGQDRGDRRRARKSAGPQPGSSGRDPLLHPLDGSLVGARSVRFPLRGGSRPRCQAPAISCTCRSTSIIASATTRRRWRPTRRRSPSTKPISLARSRSASIRWPIIRTTCIR